MFLANRPAPTLQPMISSTDRHAAFRTAIGAQVAAAWPMELDGEGLEVYVTPEQALVLVDRSPLAQEGRAAWFRRPMAEWGGTQLGLVGEVEQLEGQVWHGVYSGLLGGAAVVVDQYVRMRNCMPLAIVRVISRVNATTWAAPMDHARYVELVLEID